MPKFKATPANIQVGKLFGMGTVKLKGKKFVISPIKRKGVNTGPKKTI